MSTTDIDQPSATNSATNSARHRTPCPTSRPDHGTTLRRHLRAALTGTLLAIVAITGLSAYAAAGITEARSTALCQAHITCR